MKKSLSIVLVLLCLLTACQVVPDDDQSLASTPSSSGSITPPPSSSVVPPSSSTAPTVPTTQPTVPPTLPPALPPSDISDGDIKQSGTCLYWVVKNTQERILISDQVLDYEKNDTHIFFVKMFEPTKIYVVAIGDFANQQLCYESAYGNITFMYIARYADSFLQFVEGEKRFFVLDMTTCVTTLLIEQYYIRYADIEFDDGAVGDWVWFEGKLTEDQDGGSVIYRYNRITGEYEIDDSL